ncbi:ZNF598 [Mytilus edulis]|uniref:ZNF598 n=1 Tax=Mytilus edulis TaxID=6550 RepID=A0A8S3R306_MYTED|nr:ZNF598 [Mytilus edulis]
MYLVPQLAGKCEEDVQKAIHASLDVMKEKEKVEEQPEKEEEEEVKVLRNAKNFPVLGNNDLRVDSPDDSDHKDSDSEALDFSMAQQIALKNKRSVQVGRLISEEFPSLSGEPSTKDKTAETLEKKPSIVKTSKPEPIVKSQPVSKSVSKPVSKFTVSKGPVVDDFPGLPTKSSSINSALGSAKWVPKQTAKETKQAAAMPVQVTMNVSANNQKSSKNKTKSSNKAFQDEKDFPSLGGQPTSTSASNMNWLQKSAKGKSKPIQERKPIDWFDADNDFDFSIENVTKLSKPILTDDKNSNTSDSKKKKKKKDKSKPSDNDIINDSKPKGGSSLDSIASSLFSTKGVTNKEPVKVESPKVVRKEESDRSPSPENFKIVHKKVKTADIPEDNNKFSILSNETEIKPFVESKPRFVPKQNDKNLKLDDFPTLGSSNQSKAPPPGFAKPLPSNSSVPSVKPPGFDNVSSSKRPPPGFAMPTSSQKNGHSTSEEKSCTFTLKNIMPMMTEMSNFDYVAPENSKVRNQKLIGDIRLHLGEDIENFDQFKTVSASFRQGTTDATEYYKQCEQLIGKDNFDIIFPELLVLLPDINKQQELLTTYKSIQEKNKSGHVIRISGKSADAPWKQTSNFQTCPTCRQVLLSSDYTDHTSIHGSASDFLL